jgi:hypothetical protein
MPRMRDFNIGRGARSFLTMAKELYSCFISYRHPATTGGREEKLIQHVVSAIKDHLEVYTHEHGVYFDQQRLIPGYEYDERLATAICRSACMIVVYWPSYLESDYCNKELKTMLAIEKERRARLAVELRGCRLFVPVIIRGKFEDLPLEVRDGCQYLDYRAQAIRPDFNIGNDPHMSEKLYGIAEYVKSLCDKMALVENELFGKCEEYVFPTVASGKTEVTASAASLQPFPGR